MLARKGHPAPPRRVRTKPMILIDGTYHARTYRGVALPALCLFSTTKSLRPRYRFSWVFWSVLDCEQRLRLMHPGHNAAAKHILEDNRKEHDQQREKQKEECRLHRRAVMRAWKRYSSAPSRCLLHCYFAVLDSGGVTDKYAADIVSTVASYLFGWEDFANHSSRAPQHLPQAERSRGSTKVLKALKTCARKASCGKHARLQSNDMAKLALQLELAYAREAFKRQQPGEKWATPSQVELLALQCIDERLTDLTALRGFIDMMYNASMKSSTIAVKLRHLVVAIQWRRRYNLRICQGVELENGSTWTVTGVNMARFGAAIDMVNAEKTRFSDTTRDIDTGRGIPAWPQRSVKPDISVYDAIAAGLERDILAFAATVQAWKKEQAIACDDAYDDLYRGTVAYVQFCLVTARPLPLRRITMKQFSRAFDSAQTALSARLIGQRHGGEALRPDTLLCGICSGEKNSAKRNGNHVLILTPRILPVLEVYYMARLLLRTTGGSKAPFLCSSKGTNAELNRCVAKVSTWYSGHGMCSTDLRIGQCTAAAGDGVARFAKKVQEAEEAAASFEAAQRALASSAAVIRAPRPAAASSAAAYGTRPREAAQSKPAVDDDAIAGGVYGCNEPAPLDKRQCRSTRATEPSGARGAGSHQSEDAYSPGLPLAASRRLAAALVAAEDAKEATAFGRKQVSEDAQFRRGGGAVGHSQKTNEKHYVRGDALAKFKQLEARLARAANVAVVAEDVFAVDNSGSSVKLTGANAKRYRATEESLCDRRRLGRQDVASYYSGQTS